MKSKNKMGASGQALIEYLLLFSFMTFISITLVRGLGKTMMSSVGNIGFELTEQFTVGVCKKLCFYTGYENEAR